MTLKQLVPMLNVSDIQRSLQFYRQVAGFEQVSPQEALEKWNWAEIRSGNALLMLSQEGGGSGTEAEDEATWPSILYFYPEDVEALYQQIKAAGFEVDELGITCYGMKEFSLRDPDGHWLSFGQEAEVPAPQAA